MERCIKIILVGVLLWGGLVSAKDYTISPESKIRVNLSAQFPELTIDAVSVAKDGNLPIKSLYQVHAGSRIFYVTADGRYLLSGDLLSLEKHDPQGGRKNLTEEARQAYRLKLLTPERFKHALVYSATESPAKAQISVFSDIDCGHCREFHKQIPALNKAGITVRYLAFPRAGMDSDSYKKAATTWCAKDRRKVLDEYMSGAAVPFIADLSSPCAEYVKDQVQLGINLGLQGTPTILLDNGTLIPGYMPTEALLKMLLGNTSSQG
jgi:thiol:disulfide interchange protein DsbC